MFCLASRYQISPASPDKTARVVLGQIARLASWQPGFKGICLSTESIDDCTILTIWETEEQATSWAKNPEHEAIVTRLASAFADAVTPYIPEVFSVQLNSLMPTKTREDVVPIKSAKVLHEALVLKYFF